MSAAAGRAPFPERRSPPAWRDLDTETREAFDLGLAIFNTSWVIAGTPNAQRRDGLGPLFVAASCDGCHNNGARGRGEPVGNRLPNSFVMQLGGPPTVYGAVFATQALPGHVSEGRVELSWSARDGRYPDGEGWELRLPEYRLTQLAFGPLPGDAVLQPRIAPATFGSGLLEAVPHEAVMRIRALQSHAVRGELAWHEDADGKPRLGRFGWQAQAISIEDQTARALAREMGLTSRPHPQDDCTTQQAACRNAPQGGSPEVSDEFLGALVTLQANLAVPARPAGAAADSGAVLFERTGCASCHQSVLPVDTGSGTAIIDAYTDLLLHDMGEGLADRRVDGSIAGSQWRTAPLWGMAHALAGGDAGLLHDGRARSVEEAVLWHDGQARDARRAFERLPAAERRQLLDWVGSL